MKQIYCAKKSNVIALELVQFFLETFTVLPTKYTTKEIGVVNFRLFSAFRHAVSVLDLKLYSKATAPLIDSVAVNIIVLIPTPQKKVIVGLTSAVTTTYLGTIKKHNAGVGDTFFPASFRSSRIIVFLCRTTLQQNAYSVVKQLSKNIKGFRKNCQSISEKEP